MHALDAPEIELASMAAIGEKRTSSSMNSRLAFPLLVGAFAVYMLVHAVVFWQGSRHAKNALSAFEASSDMELQNVHLTLITLAAIAASLGVLSIAAIAARLQRKSWAAHLWVTVSAAFVLLAGWGLTYHDVRWTPLIGPF